MTQLIWTKEAFGTGCDEVDTQHIELFKRINAVLAALESGGKGADVAGLIKSMAEYTVSHFTCEEKIMDERNCVAACANKNAHAYFLKEFTRLTTQFKTTGVTPGFVTEFTRMVTSWLRSHIQTIDTNLKGTTAPPK